MIKFLQDTFSAYTDLLIYLSIGSIILLIISILFIPHIIASLPQDYFINSARQTRLRQLSFIRVIVLVAKNLLGLVLVLCGLIMLVTPGQGLLTLLAGIFILEFPGKYKFEQYLVNRPGILKTLNWIRRRKNVPDLLI